MNELLVSDEALADLSDSLLDLDLVCRLCANPSDRFVGIFAEEGVAHGLSAKINLHLPIKVADGDSLPLQCCWTCASTVLAWHELVVSCVEADRRLRDVRQQQTLKGREDDEVEVIYEDDGADSSPKNDESDTEVTATSLTVFCGSTPDGLVIGESETLDLPANVAVDKPDLWVSYEENVIKDYIQQLPPPPPLISHEEQLAKQEKLSQQRKQAIRTESLECVLSSEEEERDSDVKEEEKEKAVKKDKRKHTKLDQDAVNAARVVVEGRIYYNCKICGKSLHSPYTYIWHIRIHTGERPYVCDLCGKQFRVSQGLVRHLRETHEGVKNFPCDLCGRKFSTRRNVEEHRRIHTNERPYVCDLCGKSFKQKASLFVHNRSHSDSFPFHCSYCNLGFRTRPPLLIHVTRHTGEKPYPCEVCGRCFRIKYELKRHRLIHSDEKPFSCTECGLSFRQKRYLRNHNKVNHGRATA